MRQVERYFLMLLMTLALTQAATSALAGDPGWPREILLTEARLMIFQPQLDTFEGNEIGGRVAVAVTPAGATEQVFGAVWLEALVEIDRDERIVTAYDIRVPRVRFPDEETDEQIVALLERVLPTWEFEISLDRFLAALEGIEGARTAAANLKMDPPTIITRTNPSVLVVIDGEPIMEGIAETILSRVVNTPFLIVRDGDSLEYFLFAGTDAWYTARELTGDWTYTARVPAAVAAIAPDDSDVELPELDEAANAGENPTIVVVTEPTELIFTNGEPVYNPLGDARLMYISNTDGTLIMEIATQRHFTVLSGRWFASRSLEGPWEFIESEDLPEAFRDIPYDSDVGDVRVHVAGTDEATEAVLDAQIPQTAAVDRVVVELDLVYDGQPQYEDISGTSMQWAVNTDKQVLAADGRYWVCDGAVWYVSDSPIGPWEVAVTRPSEVDSIPPDNPNYNIKYAHIYGATPEVVYVGYTPGYTHTYIHHVTIVHGTGFHHHPWHHTMFIPRHATWGFSVRFHPWWGWSSGVVFSNGRFTFGIGFSPWSPWHGGWWGPSHFHSHWRGHRRGFYSGWNRGFHQGARAGYRAGFRAGVRAGAGMGSGRQSVFQSPNRGGARVRDHAPRSGNFDRSASGRVNAPGSISRTQPNNVFADRNGNVHQRNPAGGWQERSGGNWSPADRAGTGQRQTTGRDRSTTQRSGAATQRDRGSSLERDHAARQRGTQRSNNFNSRGGGTGRAGAGNRAGGGGGGRRR